LGVGGSRKEWDERHAGEVDSKKIYKNVYIFQTHL